MNKQIAWSIAATLAIAPAAWATDSQAAERKDLPVTQAESAAPATYDVFIDGVTGYAFSKTPAGWKFIRSLRDDPASPASGTRLATK